MSFTGIVGDCLDVMRAMEDDSVDLVMTSPPYEARRKYGNLNFTLRGEEWVEWAVERFMECLRVCRGLVVWVVEGVTKNYRYSCTPFLLMADLHRRGVCLRKPAVFHRVGIPGSGGPDYLRNDWEPIVCATKRQGKLPWSDNTAMGHPPKWAPGGEMSHRTSSGARVNQWGHSIESGGTVPLPDGDFTSGAKRPSHRDVSRRDKWGGTGHASSGEGRNPDGSFKTRNRKSFAEKVGAGAKVHTKNDGDKMREQAYLPPVLANPGNVIKCKVGGGLLGHPLAHENEAPYPLRLAEWYVRSFCQPGGTVLDPFVGSGTTAHAAIVGGRQCIGIDAREDQIAIANRRIGTIERPVVGAT